MKGIYKRVQKPTYSSRGLHAMMPAGSQDFFAGPIIDSMKLNRSGRLKVPA